MSPETSACLADEASDSYSSDQRLSLVVEKLSACDRPAVSAETAQHVGQIIRAYIYRNITSMGLTAEAIRTKLVHRAQEVRSMVDTYFLYGDSHIPEDSQDPWSQEQQKRIHRSQEQQKRTIRNVDTLEGNAGREHNYVVVDGVEGVPAMNGSQIAQVCDYLLDVMHSQ